MVIGLVGLAALAIPAFGHSHGAISGHGAHGISHAHVAGVSQARSPLQQLLPADPVRESRWRFVPSPRAVFSVLALYGAFGNAGVHAFQFSPLVAALAAILPTWLVERVFVRPLWNALFRLQGAACSPLDQLISSEARAVVPFRNGRGLVSTVRDGRLVQLAACLRKGQESFPVKVGDRLLIEEVDSSKERVTVSAFVD
jgi:hypothetical protein